MGNLAYPGIGIGRKVISYIHYFLAKFLFCFWNNSNTAHVYVLCETRHDQLQKYCNNCPNGKQAS